MKNYNSPEIIITRFETGEVLFVPNASQAPRDNDETEPIFYQITNP